MPGVARHEERCRKVHYSLSYIMLKFIKYNYVSVISAVFVEGEKEYPKYSNTTFICTTSAISCVVVVFMVLLVHSWIYKKKQQTGEYVFQVNMRVELSKHVC